MEGSTILGEVEWSTEKKFNRWKQEMLDHLVKKCIVSFNLIVTKRKFSYIQNNRVIVMIGV